MIRCRVLSNRPKTECQTKSRRRGKTGKELTRAIPQRSRHSPPGKSESFLCFNRDPTSKLPLSQTRNYRTLSSKIPTPLICTADLTSGISLEHRASEARLLSFVHDESPTGLPPVSSASYLTTLQWRSDARNVQGGPMFARLHAENETADPHRTKPAHGQRAALNTCAQHGQTRPQTCDAENAQTGSGPPAFPQRKTAAELKPINGGNMKILTINQVANRNRRTRATDTP